MCTGRRARADWSASGRVGDDVQGSASAPGTGSVKCALLLFGQQGAEMRSVGAEMKPREGQRLASVAVGKQSEMPDLHETRRQNVEQEAADELGCVESHAATSVVVPGVLSAGRLLLSSLSGLRSLPLEIRHAVNMAGRSTSAPSRGHRMEAWSRPPTLFGAVNAAEHKGRVPWIVEPACRRSIVGYPDSSA